MNDGLLKADAIRRSWTPTSTTARALLNKAKSPDSGDAALQEFVITRGLNWLAANELVFADRGSIGKGAKTAGLERRSSTNMREALLRNPTVAIGLFHELMRASGAHGADPKSPREVGEDGKPIPGTIADAQWFQKMFPKTARGSGGNGGGAGKRTRKPTKAEVLAKARQDLVDDAFRTLPATMGAVFDSITTLTTAARAVGQAPFGPEHEHVAASLADLFERVRLDARALVSMLKELEDVDPDLDFECRTVMVNEPEDGESDFLEDEE